jgi:hypothetical protein
MNVSAENVTHVRVNSAIFADDVMRRQAGDTNINQLVRVAKAQIINDQ